MKNNTVVIACDKNYYWGVFLLLASMRKSGMDEPVMVFHLNLTTEMQSELAAFGDVDFAQAPPSKRNLTCRKGEALLAADNEYLTWVDCDGFFSGNCSELLIPRSPNEIMIRQRSIQENGRNFSIAGLYAPGDPVGPIPPAVLDVWRHDVGGSGEPAIDTCVTACIMSFHRSQRAFIERWQRQMDTFLPDRNTGVTNPDGFAYWQLDESVLNSLLAFMPGAPKPGGFRLDADKTRRFIHLVSSPKPWQWWNRQSLRFHDEMLAAIPWAEQKGLLLRTPPLALHTGLGWLHKMTPWWSILIRAKRKLKIKLQK